MLIPLSSCLMAEEQDRTGSGTAGTSPDSRQALSPTPAPRPEVLSGVCPALLRASPRLPEVARHRLEVKQGSRLYADFGVTAKHPLQVEDELR